VKAIQFFTSTEIQRKFALEAGFIPTREIIFHDPQIVKKYSFFPELKKIIDNNGVDRPMTPYYCKLSFILQLHLHKALTDQSLSDMVAKKAMNAAYEETKEVFSSDGKKPPNLSCDWKQ
jgi:multiple sugar transport system substrate-binding protein